MASRPPDTPAGGWTLRDLAARVECRSLQGSKLGPGTYQMKSSVDELLSRHVSEKGPYQVFSLNRSAPIKTGHYALMDSWDLSPDFPSKDFPDSESFARQLEKNKNGTFSKLTRFPKKPSDRITNEYPGLEPKNPDFPGPGTYEARRSWDPTDFHQKKMPFNATSTRNDKFAFTNAGSLHVSLLPLSSSSHFHSVRL